MKKLLIACLAAVALQVPAVEVAGMKFDETAKVAGQDLVLNGIGIRIKYMIAKVYVAALYTPKKTSDAEAVITGAGVRRMSMTMLRTIQLEDLYKSLSEGMINNSTPAEFAALAARMKVVKAKLDEVGSLEKGDVVNMDFTHSKGVIITVKGKPTEVIEGEDFSRILLGIWFGKKPIQEDLKAKLLGAGT